MAICALWATIAAALLTGLSIGIGGFMLVMERATDGMAILEQRLHNKSEPGGGRWPSPAGERFDDGARW